MEIIEYTDDRSSVWNEFVDESKNATFMFDRGYMDYHSDRFEDASLMIYYKQRPLALFPANRVGDTLISHGGLTFGGVLTSGEMTMPKMMDVFNTLETYLSNEGVETVKYKAIPSIYHSIPAEGDRYALFRKDAKLYRRDVTSAVYLPDRLDFKRNRRQTIERATEHGVSVRESEEYGQYWEMLRTTLAKHDVEPVHTVEEMLLLHERFPENLKLYGAYQEGDLVAGAIVYMSNVVARTQYIASNDAGDEVRATDLLLSELITKCCDHLRYFDFGISTEQEGKVLNEGLSYFKETFGARPVVHDFYEWVIDA